MSRQGTIIAPSLLGADFSHLSQGLEDIRASGAPWIHVDIMDGQFVPNMAFSPRTVRDIRPKTHLFLDVHLMVQQPASLIDALFESGADCITFHIEAVTHPLRLIRQIHDKGCQAGIALGPGTPVASILELLPVVDQVLVMSVNPGFDGETYLPSSARRVGELEQHRRAGTGQYRIAVDGGICVRASHELRAAGADVLVVGRAFFAATDRAGLIADLVAPLATTVGNRDA